MTPAQTGGSPSVHEDRPALRGTVRSTRQRAAITALLQRTDEFKSAQDLHDELKRDGEGIGLTTVYRTLQSMSTSGEVDVLRNDTGESVYRRCSDGHHHHLVCQSCGFAVGCRRARSRSGRPTSPKSTVSPRSTTPSRSSVSAAAAPPSAEAPSCPTPFAHPRRWRTPS
ncbi:Putative ferric uptake regulator FurB [Mycobacteroides abscessus]|nr:Putative ferric uptake regulator FurB [Mycobacteroides abscessus]